MDFLDNIVLPQSYNHLILLKYLLALTFILLVPYLATLYGSLVYSIFFRFKSRKGDSKFSQLAKDTIDIITFNKSIVFALGAVPLLSAAFAYTQLLHQTNAIVSTFMIMSLVCFLISIVFIYTYKHSLHLKDLFNAVNSDNQKVKEDVELYKSRTTSLFSRSGNWGLVFLTFSIYLFVTGNQLALDPNRWDSITSGWMMLFSWDTVTYFLHFITASLAIASAVILFYYFRPSSEVKLTDEVKDYTRKFALTTGLIFTIFQPVFYTLNLLTKPSLALFSGVFAVSIFVLFTLLVISNLFYIMIKESNTKFSSSLLYLFVVLFALYVVKENFAFTTAASKQTIILADNYTQYETKLKEELGLSNVVISGEDIYNGKCIACHQFDRVLVGPAYKDVLPKYEGKRDELIRFILNPARINPDKFPAMPSQGLKPKEAEAVADYIVQKYQ